jgi:hypothetical protein
MEVVAVVVMVVNPQAWSNSPYDAFVNKLFKAAVMLVQPLAEFGERMFPPMHPSA